MSATCGEAVWSGPRPWGIWPAAAGPALPFGSRECGLSHLPASGLGVSLCLKAWGPSKYLGWKCSFSFAHSFEPAPLSTPPRPGGWELPIQAWGFSDSDGPDPVRAGVLAFFASVFIFCIAHCSSPYPHSPAWPVLSVERGPDRVITLHLTIKALQREEAGRAGKLKCAPCFPSSARSSCSTSCPVRHSCGGFVLGSPPASAQPQRPWSPVWLVLKPVLGPPPSPACQGEWGTRGRAKRSLCWVALALMGTWTIPRGPSPGFTRREGFFGGLLAPLS